MRLCFGRGAYRKTSERRESLFDRNAPKNPFFPFPFHVLSSVPCHTMPRIHPISSIPPFHLISLHHSPIYLLHSMNPNSRFWSPYSASPSPTSPPRPRPPHFLRKKPGRGKSHRPQDEKPKNPKKRERGKEEATRQLWSEKRIPPRGDLAPPGLETKCGTGGVWICAMCGGMLRRGVGDATRRVGVVFLPCLHCPIHGRNSDSRSRSPHTRKARGMQGCRDVCKNTKG